MIKFSIFSPGFDYNYFWVLTINALGQVSGTKSQQGRFVPDNTSEIEFIKAEQPGVIEITGSILYDFNIANSPSGNKFVSLIKTFGDGSPAQTLKTNLYTGQGLFLNQELDISDNYTLDIDDRLILFALAVTDPAGEPTASVLSVKESTINLTQKDQALPTASKGALLYDCFNRSIEAMTGVGNSLTSAVLEDVGEFADYTLQNGFLIRNYLPKESALSWKFKDLFRNMEKVFNIGLAIKSDNTTEIRKKKDFFKDGVIHTVTPGDLEADSFSREIDTDYFFSDIEIGYTKSAYEEISGLEEYNNKSFYNTFLSIINNKLDGISKIRGDGYGMEFARRKQRQDDKTEDTKYDKDLFLLNVIADGLQYKQLTTEGFSDISGIDQISTPTNLKNNARTKP